MSIRLVILGLLMEQDSHPYEIRQKVKEREMHHYIKMQDGSLYYAIDQLRKERLVDVVQVVKDSGRPDRTIYRITEAGRQKFQEMLIEQMLEPFKPFHPLYAALSFARHGDSGQIANVLKERIGKQEEKVRKMRELYEEHIPEVSRSVLHMMYGGYLHAKTELEWLRSLYEDALHDRLKVRGKPLDSAER